MKDELLRVIREFNEGVRSIDQLQMDFLDLIKRGVEGHLTKPEAREFRILYSGWVDMYDKGLQPRPGIIGSALDVVDQVFRSNYRISLEQVREKTQEFENLLMKR